VAAIATTARGKLGKLGMGHGMSFTVADRCADPFNETYLVDLDEDKVILYAPLRGVALLINASAAMEWSQAHSNPSLTTPIVKELQSTILRHELFQFPTASFSDCRPTHVSLALSLGCTMRCGYCHADAGIAGAVLPWNIAKKAIDIAYSNAQDSNEDFLMSFSGGGEPTYEWKLFKRCVEYFHTLPPLNGPKRFLTMATNGYYSRKKAEFVMEHFSGVSLSMDGPPEFHDLQRRAPNDTGTFDVVFENAKHWFKNEFPFSLRATISDRSVHSMDDIVLFFHHHFPGRTIGLEPLTPFGRGQDSDFTTPSSNDYIRNFTEIIDLGTRLGIDVINSGTIKIEGLRPQFCKSIGLPGMVVTPDGFLAACERDNVPREFYYGQWNDQRQDFDIDLNKVNDLRKFNASSIPECEHCFFKWHCAGDCLHLRLSGLSRCEVNRELLRYVLRQTMMQSQNLRIGFPTTDRWNKRAY